MYSRDPNKFTYSNKSTYRKKEDCANKFTSPNKSTCWETWSLTVSNCHTSSKNRTYFLHHWTHWPGSEGSKALENIPKQYHQRAINVFQFIDQAQIFWFCESRQKKKISVNSRLFSTQEYFKDALSCGTQVH